jgi:membrane fusion protein, multidrug efflux system
MKTKKIISFIVPVLTVILMTACSGSDSDNAGTATATNGATGSGTTTAPANGAANERIVAVGTMNLDRITFEDRIRINGTVTAHDDAMISVETPGQVRFIADRGTTVNRGDVILRLDDRLLQANYEATRTGFELAEDVYQRQAALHADSVISTVQYLQSKAQRDQAAAQLAAVTKQLEDSQLRAPFSGRIEEKFSSVGQFVAPGQPVLRLVNTSNVRVTGGVPERFSGRITAGTPVEVIFRNYSIDPRLGEVRFASNLVNPDSRTFPAEVVLSNPDGAIKPLMVVEMRVLRSLMEDRIVIPRTAVVRDETGDIVYAVSRVNGQNRAQLRRISIEVSSGDFVVVGSGLEAGDVIVVSGLTNLGDGDLLNITSTATNTQFATEKAVSTVTGTALPPAATTVVPGTTTEAAMAQGPATNTQFATETTR